MRLEAESEDTAVIDDGMIAESFEEHGLGEDEIGNPIDPRGEGVTDIVLADQVSEARSLKLSFKSILKIDNLQGFGNLRRLCLDNNIIHEIANLGHLVHLEWLDLSFNNISKIQGLEKLTKLTDLSLFSNQISEIDGLDGCTALQCLSLGNNRVASMDTVIKLRRFKSLQLLNLEGNPVSKEGEYRSYILAYVSQLKYFDYTMVLPSEVAAAREQFQDELLDVEEKEALEQEKDARETAAREHTAKLKEANLAVVETLFKDMFDEDEEHKKIKFLPGINDVISKFSGEVDEVSQTFITAGLDWSDQKATERKAFMGAVNRMRSYYISESVKLIESWNQTKKRKVKELMQQDLVELEDLSASFDTIEALGNELMDLELRQVDHFEEIMNDFDTKYRELNAACVEAQIAFFRQVEECENTYFKDLSALANDLLEKAAKEELGDDVPDEAANLLVDRDTCMTAIGGSHDVHVGKLYKGEELMKYAETQHLNETLGNLKEEEHQRNRSRIMEIQRFMSENRRELERTLTVPDIGDDDDFGDAY